MGENDGKNQRSAGIARRAECNFFEGFAKGDAQRRARRARESLESRVESCWLDSGAARPPPTQGAQTSSRPRTHLPRAHRPAPVVAQLGDVIPSMHPATCSLPGTDISRVPPRSACSPSPCQRCSGSTSCITGSFSPISLVSPMRPSRS